LGDRSGRRSLIEDLLLSRLDLVFRRFFQVLDIVDRAPVLRQQTRPQPGRRAAAPPARVVGSPAARDDVAATDRSPRVTKRAGAGGWSAQIRPCRLVCRSEAHPLD